MCRDGGTGALRKGTFKCNVYEPVAPVAYQVILEPGIGQFRELESPE